jgi:hypothetical protein
MPHPRLSLEELRAVLKKANARWQPADNLPVAVTKCATTRGFF